MVRTMSVTFAVIAFLPIAIILLLFGINKVHPSKRKGMWLRLAVIINSALVIALGIIGCKGGGGNLFQTCYKVVASDLTEVPEAFDQSDDWSKLESALGDLEYYISAEKYNEELGEELHNKTSSSINNLNNNGLITDDDATVLRAYCNSRYDYYFHMIGGWTCYEPMPVPEGKEATKGDIVAATDELRQLYADGKIETSAYETTLAKLDADLKMYTDKEDNTVLRQLLLDLADGRSGSYF